MHVQFSTEKEFMDYHELHIHKQLHDHPNILKIINTFSDSETNTWFIVYEMVETSLQNYYEFLASLGKKIAEDEILQIMGQILGAMKFMKGKNIFHGNLNCSNIYVHKDIIKIGKFYCFIYLLLYFFAELILYTYGLQ